MAIDASVAVIGGGYAGMAAAVTLASRGVPVTVYEAGAVLGGRARRVTINDTALDNGLHLMIGAYTEMLRLIDTVAPGRTDALLRVPLDWHIHNAFRLRAAALPAPLHVAAGLLRATGISCGDKISLLHFMRAVKAQRYRVASDITVAALLREYTQPYDLIAYLWSPLCVAALNTPPERASAQVFLNVLRDSLGADRAASDLVLAGVDLSALFPEPAADYVRTQGGTVELNTIVDRITGKGRAFSIHVRGAARPCSHVICAVAPHRAAPMLAELPALRDTARQIDALSYEPIHSIYLQFGNSVSLPAAMIGLSGSPAQWLFDRERICGQRGLVGAVISASEAHVGERQDALAQRIQVDLRTQFGPLPPLVWHRVIAEKRATFSCVPGVVRPASITACRNFFLAGDYTASDYPATLESAVRSGVQCAEAVLAG